MAFKPPTASKKLLEGVPFDKATDTATAAKARYDAFDKTPSRKVPNAEEPIDFIPSWRRVIALIENLKAFAGSGFPSKNGTRIPSAFLVVDGEPTP